MFQRARGADVRPGAPLSCGEEGEVPYGTSAYGTEAKRLYGVMDRQLSDMNLREEYSIADIAIYPWVRAMNGIASSSRRSRTCSAGKARSARARRS